MGPFQPADSPEVPAVVRRYEAARRRWAAVAYDPDRAGDPAWPAFAHATAALRERVEGQGGRWEVGGLIYRLAAGGGIGIEQAPNADAERAPGEVGDGPGESEDRQGTVRRIGRRPVRRAKPTPPEQHHGIGIEQAAEEGVERDAVEQQAK